MTFDDSRAPGQGQAGDEGSEIAFEAVGEGVQAGQVIGGSWARTRSREQSQSAPQPAGGEGER
ncbi:hypothetical protein AB0A71_41695 [Kitasatospora aureofaciens]|uniref:hypothetical protein n=1 Tax=Kitasatospora aureofaciens TaxID=1894 RepID=UPI0033ED4AFE